MSKLILFQMRILYFFLLGLLLITCKRQQNSFYPENNSISDPQGFPIDSSVSYFPDSLTQNGKRIFNPIDSLYWGSDYIASELRAFKEPLLYNYYLGYDCYRFLWLRAFHPPVVLSIKKDNTRVWLSVKKLNQDAFDPDPVKTIDILTGKESPYIDTSSTANKWVFITVSDRIEMSLKDWKEFESLLNDSSFWNAPIIVSDHSLDGAKWIFEAHKSDRYWVVDRHSPIDNNIFKAGKFLIDKSGLKEVVY